MRPVSGGVCASLPGQNGQSRGASPRVSGARTVIGRAAEGRLDIVALRERITSIETHLHRSIRELLDSQGVRLLAGTGRFKGPNEVVVDTGQGLESLEADFIVLATGSRPRIPEWATVDGERVLTTRQSY